METSKEGMNRREFLGKGARGAGFLAITGAAVTGAEHLAQAAAGSSNPFAYDVGRFEKTDPKLIQYEEAGRFACPSPEPRRIALGPDDRLYVASSTGVNVVDSNGRRLDDLASSGPARCVAVAGDGTVYTGLHDHVEVFDKKGQHLATWETPGKKAWFSGMCVGEKDLFVADSGGRVVLRYDRSGKLAGRIGEKNKERNVPGLIVPSPYLDV